MELKGYLSKEILMTTLVWQIIHKIYSDKKSLKKNKISNNNNLQISSKDRRIKINFSKLRKKRSNFVKRSRRNKNFKNLKIKSFEKSLILQ